MKSTDPVLKKGDKVSFTLYTHPYEIAIGTILKVRKSKLEHNIAIYDIECEHPNISTGKTTRFHGDVSLELE